MLGEWTCQRPDRRTSKELLFEITGLDSSTNSKLIILPALFDEANKLRRQTVLIMRCLAELGIGSALPDLPGMNESLAPLGEQSLTQWHKDAAQAAEHLGATHVLAIRGGALIAPDGLPGWQYAPASGPRLLRNMLRARVLASKEAGRAETTSGLGELGAKKGIELAGWQFGAVMFGELQSAEPAENAQYAQITQSDIGGAALWLRAEADDDAAQAKKLASIIAEGIMGTS